MDKNLKKLYSLTDSIAYLYFLHYYSSLLSQYPHKIIPLKSKISSANKYEKCFIFLTLYNINSWLRMLICINKHSKSDGIAENSGFLTEKKMEPK